VRRVLVVAGAPKTLLVLESATVAKKIIDFIIVRTPSNRLVVDFGRAIVGYFFVSSWPYLYQRCLFVYHSLKREYRQLCEMYTGGTIYAPQVRLGVSNPE